MLVYSTKGSVTNYDMRDMDPTFRLCLVGEKNLGLGTVALLLLFDN